MARALVFDELSVRPRADPRVVLRTLLHVLRVVCWSSAPLSSSARYAWTLSTARSGCSRSRRQPALVRSRWMRSWSLFYFGFRVAIPPICESSRLWRVLSLPQLSRCVWLRVSWSVGTSRCRHVMLINHSACLVEPFVVKEALLLLPVREQAASTTSSAASGRREAFLLKVLSLLLRAARSQLLCRRLHRDCIKHLLARCS